MKGKIVLVPFPFTDLSSEPSEVDVLITKKHSAFKNAGLKVASVVKLDKIATVLEDLIVGEIGELNQELRKEVNQKIKKILEI